MRFIVILILITLGLLNISNRSVFAQTTEFNVAPEDAEAQVEPTPLPPLENENPINLTISPISLNIEADPGETVQSQIRVRNNSTTTEVMQLSVGAFTADETGERPQLLDEVADSEFLSWLTFDQNIITVEPNEWSTINVTFSPPSTAALSYYYAIYLTRYQQLSPGELETKINATPAILVLTTVNSPFAKKELQIESFTPKYSFLEYLPQEFSVSVRNSGNVHLVPTGNIFIDGQGTKDLSILSLNPNSSQILPQSTRTFTVRWNEGFPLNIQELEENDSLKFFGLAWDFSKAHHFRLGKYTANLLLVYDNGDRDIPIESSLSFWVVPWKLLLVFTSIGLLAILGIGTIVFGLYRLFRRNKR